MTQAVHPQVEIDSEPPSGLLQARRKIHQFIGDGVVSSAVIQALTLDGRLVNKECDLWDFKQAIASDSIGLASVCLDIVAFHNTYGGFLIIGVEELDTSFSPAGIRSGDVDFRQLYDKLKAYTNCDIDCSHVEIESDVQGRVLAIIHIPKRVHGTPPVVFLRNGPNLQTNRPLFRAGDFPVRVGHESKIASSKEDFTLLQTDRRPPVFAGISESADMLASIQNTRRLENNLPDKAMICAQFVGRTEILARLWQWMSDAFSKTKVLAGDGGKGKTSIAYQFASEAVTVRPGELMQVIWLSAKRRQFFGLANSYSDLGDPDYEDLESLLRVICRHSGVTENELSESVSLNMLKSLARSALEMIPALVVIDDVDSLESNEQRRVFETATQIAGSRSRFLITTRANNSYSSDLCINIPGLGLNDFSSFITAVTEKIGLRPFAKGAIEQLHGAIDGSPLLAESIVRLVKQGLSLSSAIAQWRTHSGEDARSAVLKKEVDSLDAESRRTLLAMACLRECSRSELQQLTGYGTVKLGDCIDRLQALFLVAAPMVTEEEARFSVSDVVRTLILETRASLAVDSNRLISDAKDLQARKKASPSAQNWIVGAAINQANAQLGGNQAREALDTIQAALRRAPRHRDLLSMLGRCFLASIPQDLTAARDAFRQAHEGGNRKPILFHDWYQAEVAAEHWPGAVAVAGHALKAGMDTVQWHHHRAYARVAHAALRLRHSDRTGAVSEYDGAASDLATCIRESKGLLRQDHISESAEITDRLWALHSTSAASPSHMFGIAERAISRGDVRILMFKRLVDSLRAHARLSNKASGDSASDSLAGMIRSARDRLSARKEQLPANESRIAGFLSEIDDIEARLK